MSIQKAQDTLTKSFLDSKRKISLVFVKAPKVIWKSADAFPLAKIKERFVIPPFERKASGSHINRIAIAILNNEFYDNIIRVIKTDDNKFLVIDGQHRLAALWKAHVLFGLEKYDLLLGIYEKESEARIIYQKINSGMQLKIIEAMKAMDDGTIKFFNEMRPFCSHDLVGNSVTFYDVLNAIFIARRDEVTTKSVTRGQLLEEIQSVSDIEIGTVQMFLDMMYAITPQQSNKMYNANIFRILYKLHHQYKLRQEELIKLVNVIVNNESLQLETRSKERLVKFYQYSLKQLSRIREK